MSQIFNNPRIITDKSVEKKEREKVSTATFGSGMLYGVDGKPIYDKELKQRAIDMYAEFVNKHQREVQEWFNDFGQQTPLPIHFNERTKQLEWDEQKLKLAYASKEAGIL